MSAPSVRSLARSWVDRLAPYRHHRNDEHLEALLEESARYAGLHLENDLATSRYWAEAPLSRRVAVLLFLVDRGVVTRRVLKGRRLYEPSSTAETWVMTRPDLAPYAGPTLELIEALRREYARRVENTRA